MTNPKTLERVYAMPFGSVYPHYVAKAEKKGRTKREVDAIIRWLTGYTQPKLVLEFAEALTSTPAQVTDDLSSRLDAAFTERQRVALASVISWENARSRFNRGIDVEADGLGGGALPGMATAT